MNEYYKVTLAHAVSNELGKSNGGKPGDQKQNKENTRGELLFQDWYISGGEKWDCVLRCKDKALRYLIADDAIDAVRNPHIGYSQEHRYTLYDNVKPLKFATSKVTKDVECDCSSLATVCANYAGIPIPRDTYTANMQIRYTNSKQFKAYTTSKYTKSATALKEGDILVRAGHHTAIVANIYYHMTRELYYDGEGPLMTGADVKALQARLNELIDAKLIIDGELGRKTDAAIRSFQRQNGLTVDGIAGRHTLTTAGFLYR